MKRYIYYIVFVAALMNSCYKEKDYELKENDPRSLFELKTDKSTAPADSLNTIRVTVIFADNIDTSKSKVTFRTTAGLFTANNTQLATVTPTFNIDSSKTIATVFLKSTQKTGEAKVSAEVAGLTKEITVSFTHSFPEMLELAANKLSVKPSNTSEGEVVFTARLSKALGLPSLNSKTELNVFDTNYNKIGYFREYNNLSGPGGTTTFTYVLGDSTANGFNYYGRLIAISTAITAGTPLRDTVLIFSTK